MPAGDSGEPRQKTGEEIRDEFFYVARRLMLEWKRITDENGTGKLDVMDGFFFSLLNVFDGMSGQFGCSLLLVPTCHEGDPDFCRSEGEDWYPVNAKAREAVVAELSAGDMLHDAWHAWKEMHGYGS